VGLPEGLQRWELAVSPLRGRWTDVSASETSRVGVYRTAREMPRQWYARLTAGRLVELRTVEQRLAAQWRLLRRARARYHRATRELDVPAAGVLLPLVLDRALRLASGRAPRFSPHGPCYIYPGIDLPRARDAARVLGLPLERLP
jgi:hypothetical protein